MAHRAIRFRLRRRQYFVRRPIQNCHLRLSRFRPRLIQPLKLPVRQRLYYFHRLRRQRNIHSIQCLLQ